MDRVNEGCECVDWWRRRHVCDSLESHEGACRCMYCGEEFAA